MAVNQETCPPIHHLKKNVPFHHHPLSSNIYLNFMMPTLKKANELNGYFMTDSSTWVVSKNSLENVSVLFKGL